MRALASAEVLIANNANSINEPDKSQSSVQYLRKNMARLRLNVISSKKSQPSCPINHTEVRRLSSENPDRDICGQHFLFDKRWRNGIYFKNHFRDEEQLMKPSLPLVSQDHPAHQFHNLNRFSQSKKVPYTQTSQYTFGMSENYGLTSVQVLLTVTTPSISRRNQCSESFKYRPFNNRIRSIFGFKNTTFQYPDPVLGAPAALLQRISQISSLEEETVRQEKIKILKNNKKRLQ